MLRRALLIGCLLLLARCESAPDIAGDQRPEDDAVSEVPGYKPFWDGHRWGWYR
jgi:hypothetical protein